MADTTIDKLALDISVKENDSAKKINSVASAIEKLQKSLSGLSTVQNQMKKITNMFSSFSLSTQNIQTPQFKIETAELEDKPIGGIGQLSIAGSKAEGQIRALDEALKSTQNSIKQAGKQIEKSQPKWDKFINSIKRIALYRAIRAILKEITQALVEGFQNFVQFDDVSNKAMSNVTNSVNQLKNTLGVTLGYLVQSLEPILVSLSDMAVSLFDNLNMAMASLQGKDTYAKAIKQNKDYADSLKKVNNQLLSFDKFEVLNQSQQDSPLGLYEEVEVPAELSQTAEMFKLIADVVSTLIDLIKELVQVVTPLINPVLALVDAVLYVVDILVKVLKPVLVDIMRFAGAILQQFVGAFQTIGGLIKLLAGDFDGAWKDIGNGFANMCNGIVNMFVQLGAFIVRILKFILVDTNPLFWILKALGVADVGQIGNDWINKWSSWKLDWKPYANGGSFNTGDYFVANENGSTELVASTNRGGAVMNTEQLQAAINRGFQTAIYETGLLDAMQQQVVLEGRNIDNNSVARGLFNALKVESTRRGGNQL